MAARRTLSKCKSQRKPGAVRGPLKRSLYRRTLPAYSDARATVLNTLGTVTDVQRDGPWAARPPRAHAAAGAGVESSGWPSAGGGGCGGAGAAGWARTSHPRVSVLARGNSAASADVGSAASAAVSARALLTPPHRSQIELSRASERLSRVPPIAAAADFIETPLLVFGLLLALGALVGGLARRSILSLASVFVVAGFILGNGGLEVLDLDPKSDFVQGLAVIALILILFRDGLEVEKEMLQQEWHLPFRKLILAMPLTAGLIAVVTNALTDLGWTESFLVGALLSPTDPVLSSAVINNPRVPRLIRHSLNLESGLNDGLALPAVLAFTAAAESRDDFVWWEFALQDVGVGFATGMLVAFLASRIMPRRRGLGADISPHQKGLYGLAVAFVAYGAAVLPPAGNGFISVFVAAIAFGIWRPDVGSASRAARRT